MSLTINVPKVVMSEQKIKLNVKQKAFCDLYVSFKDECYGNATKCYMKAYGQKNYASATVGSKMLMEKPEITAYINALLSAEGFNDENVDKQHLFIINQHKDLSVKMKGIEHYNKLKKRISDRLEIVMPKPIIDLDGDTEKTQIKARKLDKQDDNVVQYDVSED